jgi:hypothetical protein
VASEFKDDQDKYAQKHNLKIVLPEPNQLQLDIDSTKLPEFHEHHIYILEQFNKVTAVRTTKSKSGNMHVYIDLERPVDPYERIALQACLGSDLKRELLTLNNLKDPSNTRPQFLFEVNS